MPIQNISSLTQATQPIRAVNGKDASVAAARVLNTDSQPDVALELPKIDAEQTAQTKPTDSQLQSATDSINKALKQINRNLEFSVDSDTKKVIVKLVDTETGEVVRQFPSEEIIAISHSIDRIQQGLLLKQKA